MVGTDFVRNKYKNPFVLGQLSSHNNHFLHADKKNIYSKVKPFKNVVFLIAKVVVLSHFFAA